MAYNTYTKIIISNGTSYLIKIKHPDTENKNAIARFIIITSLNITKNNKSKIKVKRKMKKIIKFFKEIYIQSFTKNGKIHLPYVYIWVLLSFVLTVNILKVFKMPLITDQYALGLCGFVVAWIGIFTLGEIKK